MTAKILHVRMDKLNEFFKGISVKMVRQGHTVKPSFSADRYITLTLSYSWIAHQLHIHEKSICLRTRRVATVPRPPLESSRRREFRPAWYISVKFIFDLFFRLTFQILPRQRYTSQIRIRLVEYSSSEVSDPSEVLRSLANRFLVK